MKIIMAIVDDRRVRESLRLAVPRTDLIFFESTVDDALRRFVAMPADVVIVDDGPGLGLKAIPKVIAGLTASAAGRVRVPVLALSTKNDPDTLGAYRLAGAAGCLPKPFQLPDLLNMLAEHQPENGTGASHTLADARSVDSQQLVTEYKIASRWMSRAAGYLDDRKRLYQSLVDVTVDIFDAARAAILIEKGNEAAVIADHGIEAHIANSVLFPLRDGLMFELQRSSGMLDRNDLHTNESAKQLAVLGGRVAVPLIACGRTCGALIVGDRTSGGAYSREERELLALLARMASGCLELGKNHRELTRQHKRLDAVVSHLRTGVVALDPDGRITMLNEAAERIMRVAADDVLGRRAQKLGSAFADIVLRCLDDKQPRLRAEIPGTFGGGRIGLSVTPMGGEGAVALFTRLPETTLADAEQPESSPTDEEVWENLSARVAQEIKNPMVAISTFAQLLPTRYDSAEFRDEFATVVQQEVDRINLAVEQLYAYARRPSPTMSQGDLTDTARQVLDGLRAELDERGVNVSLNAPETPVTVRQDSLLLSQAIHNILRNSIDAMPEGGTLTVETRCENEKSELIVSDTGPGLTDDDLRKAFQPFYSTKEKGLGLGLAMAQRILQEHNGNLDYRRDDDAGGAFILSLPAIDNLAEQTTS